MTANCWICEGWSEHLFEFIQGLSGNITGYDPKNNPLFIHFEHENWKPRLLVKKIRPEKFDVNVL